MAENKVDLFIDSGAFSAYTQKVKVDIQEYISFIKENKSVISIYANLDVIGDAEGTLKNQRIMEKAGLKPLPCFHYGEDEKYLKIYLEEHDYIALGGMVPIQTQPLSVWLDHLYSKLICDSDGLPKVKIHGFGLTTISLMLRYPWWSVDSTSWVMSSRMGGIFIPKYSDGEWVYDQGIFNVTVSSQSPAKKDLNGHILTLPKRKVDIIMQYVESMGYAMGESAYKIEDADYVLEENEKWYGKASNGKRKVEIIVKAGLSNTYSLRDEFNVRFFQKFQESLPKWPWAFKKIRTSGFGLTN